MSVSVFVNEADEITIPLFIAASKANPSVVFADSDKTTLLKDCGDEIDPDAVDSHQIIFRTPSYADANRIIDSGIRMDDATFKINPSQMRLERICTLIKSWTFKGADGKEIKPSRENVKKLHPVVALVLGAELEIKLREINAL